MSTIRSLKFEENGIVVNGERAHTNKVVHTGDLIQLNETQEAGFSVTPQKKPLDILYRSRDALVVNKPAGMSTHPDASHHHNTLANRVCGLLDGEGDSGVFRPIGRLDADTSGLVLCAGNMASADLLAKSMQKVYVALVEGCPEHAEGLIDVPLAPQPGSAVRQQAAKTGKPCQTLYKVLASSEQASLVAVHPLTGRTHQIRAHFAHIGHPLLGDSLYGGDQRHLKRHGLHCAALRFNELSGNRPGLFCPLPSDMKMAAGVVLGENFVLQAHHLFDWLAGANCEITY